MRSPARSLAHDTAIGRACLTLTLLTCCSIASASELRRSAIVKAVENARPSVVNIHGQKTLDSPPDQFGHTEQPRRVNGMGTGVVIDPRGYIITNHHVVSGVKQIQVTLADGRSLVAEPVSYDPKTDLAIIKIDPDDQLPVISIGTSSDLMTGEDVIAVGNAYGYEHTVTRGIISALHRTVQVSEDQQYKDLIQTDASINPGNSGGPLLNIDGEMIGINVAVRAGAQGIGFAIPIDTVLTIAAQLISSEKADHLWHGIRVRQTAGQTRPRIVVERVEDNSPAAQAGIQTGDVVRQIADREIVGALDFERALLGHKPGDRIELSIDRDHDTLDLSLVMAAADARPMSVEERAWDLFGFRLQPLRGDELQQPSPPRYRGGLTVLEVRPGSTAAKQGIQPGDVLVGMHKWETVSLDNVAYVLNHPDLQELQPLKFYIIRGQSTLFGHLSVAQKSVALKPASK